MLVWQEEAALRLTQVAPGGPDYRAMTIEVQYYSQPRCLFTVPRSEFSPVPKVNGVIVLFEMRKPAESAGADGEGFLAMVSQSNFKLHVQGMLPYTVQATETVAVCVGTVKLFKLYRRGLKRVSACLNCLT